MIVLIFLKSGALFPAAIPCDVKDISEWITKILDAVWFLGFNAKTDDLLWIRVADIVAVQVTEQSRLNAGLISVPGAHGRMNC